MKSKSKLSKKADYHLKQSDYHMNQFDKVLQKIREDLELPSYKQDE